MDDTVSRESFFLGLLLVTLMQFMKARLDPRSIRLRLAHTHRLRTLKTLSLYIYIDVEKARKYIQI